LNKEFQKKLNELSKLSGYQKPKKISGSLKLDSNENFVIGKQFQSDLIDAAKKRCDIREFHNFIFYLIINLLVVV